MKSKLCFSSCYLQKSSINITICRGIWWGLCPPGLHRLTCHPSHFAWCVGSGAKYTNIPYQGKKKLAAARMCPRLISLTRELSKKHRQNPSEHPGHLVRQPMGTLHRGGSCHPGGQPQHLPQLQGLSPNRAGKGNQRKPVGLQF